MISQIQGFGLEIWQMIYVQLRFVNFACAYFVFYLERQIFHLLFYSVWCGFFLPCHRDFRQFEALPGCLSYLPVFLPFDLPSPFYHPCLFLRYLLSFATYQAGGPSRRIWLCTALLTSVGEVVLPVVCRPPSWSSIRLQFLLYRIREPAHVTITYFANYNLL